MFYTSMKEYEVCHLNVLKCKSNNFFFAIRKCLLLQFVGFMYCSIGSSYDLFNDKKCMCAFVYMCVVHIVPFPIIITSCYFILYHIYALFFIIC